MANYVIKQIVLLTVFSFLSVSINQIKASSYASPMAYCVTEDVVFMDEENRVCYIDLMALDMTISRITITNKSGKRMDRLDCLNVDVKKIVEFDLQQYPAGSYEITFETIGGSFKKSISLR